MNFQDNRSTPTIIPITVNVTVLPQPIIATAPDRVSFNWTLLTAANSGAQQLIVSNAGPATSVLSFSIAKVHNCSPWLSFSPPSGFGLASGAQVIITLSLNSYGIPQIPGEYFETLLISSPNAQNSPVAIQVCLTVFEGPCDDDDDRGVPAEWQGGDYRGGPGEPHRYGPGNQPTPGPGWADPPAPGRKRHDSDDPE